MVAIVVIICALAGYFLLTATQRRNAALHTHDSVLRDLIVEKIQSSPLKDRNITVAVNSDVATLSGSVGLPGDKDAAASLARSVAGVSDVINNIDVVGTPVSVPKPPETTSPPAATNQNQPETQPATQPQPRQSQNNSGNVAKANELVRKGNAEINDGRYDEAIDNFQKALQLDPNNTAAKNRINLAKKAEKAEQKVLNKTQ